MIDSKLLLLLTGWFLASLDGLPTILLIGNTGSGKSTLANVMLGHDKDYQHPGFMQEACFRSSDGLDGKTQESCSIKGHFLGNKDRPFKVVDTPGFLDDRGSEEEKVNQMVKYLREEVKFVNAIVLVINGQEPRLNVATKDMLKQIQTIFSDKFWSNTIIEMTRWEYPPNNPYRKSEERLKKEMNEKLKRSKLEIGDLLIPTIFADTHYNNSKDVKVGKQHFDEEMEKLWSETTKRQPFPMKDIKTALSEIKELQKKFEALEDANDELKKSQKDDSEVCLGLGVCFTKPSFGLAQFGGITGTVITVTIIMGVLLGCFCAGKVDLCALCTCCTSFATCFGKCCPSSQAEDNERGKMSDDDGDGGGDVIINISTDNPEVIAEAIETAKDARD